MSLTQRFCLIFLNNPEFSGCGKGIRTLDLLAYEADELPLLYPATQMEISRRLEPRLLVLQTGALPVWLRNHFFSLNFLYILYYNYIKKSKQILLLLLLRSQKDGASNRIRTDVPSMAHWNSNQTKLYLHMWSRITVMLGGQEVTNLPFY